MGVISETLVVGGTEKAAADLKRVGEAAAGASTAMQGTAQAGTATASSMGAVAQQMPDVITQLAGGANAFQVLTQQGLQVVQTNAALLGSLTAIMPGLGALAVAAGVGATAFFRLNEASIEAAEAQDVVAAASANLVNWSDTLRNAEIDLAEATGRLTEAEAARARLALQTQAMWLQSTEDLRKKQTELRMEQDSVTTQIVDFATEVLDVVDVAGVWSAALDMTTDSSEDLQRNLDAVNAAIGAQTEQARKTTDALDKAATAKVNAAKAAETHKKALDEEAKAADEAARAMAAFAEIAAQAVLITDPNQLEKQRIAMLQGFTGGGGSTAALQASMGAGAEARLTGALGTGGGLSDILKPLMSAISGNVGGILNVVLPPPWGQIAAALFALLSGGPGAVVNMLGGVFDLVNNVLKAIPDLLMTLFNSDALPAMLIGLIEALAPLIEGILVGAGELVVELIDALPSIIVALLQAVPDIVGALVRGLGVLVIDLVHAIVVDLPQAIGALIKGILGLNGQGFAGIGGDWGREWSRFGGWRDGGKGGGITVNGMVGDGWRLGVGIANLFDRDRGRVRGRM